MASSRATSPAAVWQIACGCPTGSGAGRRRRSDAAARPGAEPRARPGRRRRPRPRDVAGPLRSGRPTSASTTRWSTARLARPSGSGPGGRLPRPPRVDLPGHGDLPGLGQPVSQRRGRRASTSSPTKVVVCSSIPSSTAANSATSGVPSPAQSHARPPAVTAASDLARRCRPHVGPPARVVVAPGSRSRGASRSGGCTSAQWTASSESFRLGSTHRFHRRGQRVRTLRDRQVVGEREREHGPA